jgi:hypothetical protein
MFPECSPGKEIERNVRKVWYKMEDGIELLISLSFLGYAGQPPP